MKNSQKFIISRFLEFMTSPKNDFKLKESMTLHASQDVMYVLLKNGETGRAVLNYIEGDIFFFVKTERFSTVNDHNGKCVFLVKQNDDETYSIFDSTQIWLADWDFDNSVSCHLNKEDDYQYLMYFLRQLFLEQ
ncbi:hypothetical protein NYR30_04150 [Gallibacterium salpingitidis]|uniref:hypothetical protein n=1 Tax=Gallibacterium salpingitidis TaxID=505341 RepID=UPI00266F9B9F|nr:hypothetical protein [Gallibacterium salpingitidis]WKT00486.1 hypothetical protein NYR30_04150 [Gallibacterium salpingitidis]